MVKIKGSYMYTLLFSYTSIQNKMLKRLRVKKNKGPMFIYNLYTTFRILNSISGFSNIFKKKDTKRD